MPGKTTNLETVRAIALKLPDVKEHTTRLGTSFKVRGRVLACEAIHKSAEPGSLIVRLGMQQRAALLKAAPETYYVTAHYEKHAALLVRLSRIDKSSLKEVLAAAWEFEREQAK